MSPGCPRRKVFISEKSAFTAREREGRGQRVVQEEGEGEVFFPRSLLPGGCFVVRGSPPSPGIAAPSAQRAPGTRSLLRRSASSGAGLWVPRASPALTRAGQGRRGFTSAAQQPPAGRGRRGRPGSSLPHGRCLSGSPGGVGAGSVSGRSARGSGGGSGRSLPRGGSAGLRPGRAPHVPAAPGGGLRGLDAAGSRKDEAIDSFR